jgi:hypothetical protein
MPALVMCGLLASACGSASSVATGKTISARATTETLRVGRLTETFDAPLPADPAQADVVAGFRAATIVWDQSQEGLAPTSRVTACITGAALHNLADADVYMRRSKIEPHRSSLTLEMMLSRPRSSRPCL